MAEAVLEVRERVATLTLNRPESRNALSLELLASLHERVSEVEDLVAHRSADEEGVRVLVITGAGPAFCAGMDLAQVVFDPAVGGSGDLGLPLRLLRELAALTLRIRALGCVTVAAVNGPALGGGCGLACVADVAVSYEGNRMGFPEVDLGLCPGVVAPWVVRKVGPGHARRLLLLGGQIDAVEAHRIGLIDLLAGDRAGLDAAVASLAERLSGAGRNAIAQTKHFLNEQGGTVGEDVVMRGASISAEVLSLPRAQAALTERLRSRRS